MCSMSYSRVLSIQSHVVSGFVGNRCVVLTLQLHGIDVDFINSVQFTNHTYYPSWKGQTLQSEELKSLYSGLCDNKLSNYTYMMTGYIGSESFLNEVHQVVQHQKSMNSQIVYVCDPVMGDMDKLYVPEQLVEVYKNKFMSIADVILPNQYEAELLLDTKIQSESDAIRAMDSFHTCGVRTAVITSSSLGAAGQIIGFASHKSRDGNDCRVSRVRFQVPLIDVHFVGTGDLFAALFVAWTQKLGEGNLKGILEKVLSTIRFILLETDKHAREVQLARPDAMTECARYELRLVQCRHVLQHGPSSSDTDDSVMVTVLG